MMFALSDSVSKLHLVNASSQAALGRLGINTVRNLLLHFPRDWQDLSEVKQIQDIRPDEKISIRARVKKVGGKRSRWKRMSLTEALLEDDTGNVIAVWFNQPYIANQLIKGKEYYFHGKGQIYEKRLQLTHPTFEPVKEDTIHTAGIIPQYDLTEGITQKQMRYWIKQALPAASQLEEFLPETLLEKLGYPALAQAVRNVHSPQNDAAIKKSRDRLAFEELLVFQLAFLVYKSKLKKLPAPAIPFNQKLIKNFVSSLPFKLTNSQRLAVWEILQDLEKPYPMNRLLEGDVGSGKTVVAGIAALEAAEAGFQSVILAPTEILALQHFQTLTDLFKGIDISISLLTRSHKIIKNLSEQSNESRSSVSGLRSPVSDIIIGTHALLQSSVSFSNIGLLVVDEQHRFGVKQRAHLQKTNKKLVPHLLSMTATPIPRSLALAFYGDLDISRLTELPRGRKPITTRLVAPDKRHQAYDFIRKQIESGRQAYVVTPLIQESDKLGVKSATQEAKKLNETIFPELTVGLLHGRLKGEEKKKVMDDFKSGKTNILVSTTVIEVGVDVPNATIMMIENAERFGLATLHQLRGRVGRGEHQSYCFLFADNAGADTLERLGAVAATNDGFALAEKDLELRGPGEILGHKQSGFIPFKIAKLSNTRLVKKAQSEAEKLLDTDPTIKTFPDLKKQVEQIAKHIHLE